MATSQDRAAGNAEPAESAPAEAGPAESAPPESGPAETRPAETRPAETRPAETRPAKAAPAKAGPAAAGPADRKRRAILAAASVVFLREGYAGASMDEITALAGASKATVYRYFTDKQTLFSELIVTTVKAVSDPVQAEVLGLGDSGSLEAGLRDLARRLLRAITAPELLGLRRLIIGEAGRFPALGQAFYEQGPARTITALARLLSRLAGEGLLKIDHPLSAAEQLNWLIAAEPLNRAMLLGDDQPFTPAELTAHADAAVQTFLAAYRS